MRFPAPFLAAALAMALSVCCASEITPRVFNGVDTGEHEFPTQVLIFMIKYLPNSQKSVVASLCGGTIISEKWILTAAQCVNSSVLTAVSAGSHRKSNLWNTNIVGAKHTIIHENFGHFGRNDTAQRQTDMADIALLELEDALPLDGETIAAAQLAEEGQTFLHSNGVGAGWGRVTQDPTLEQWPDLLQKLESRVIECPGNVTDIVCVHSPTGSATCEGDYGGAFIVNGTVVGVASSLDAFDKPVKSNDHCGSKHTWSVYVQVSSYRQWIKKHSGV